MNRFDFSHSGGFPLHVDDLKFLYETFKESLNGFASISQGTQAVILSGCIATSSPSNLVITSGFVYFENEIFYFPGQTVPQPNSSAEPWWRVKEDVDPTGGTKVFKDTNTHEVRFIRRAELYQSNIGALSWRDSKKFDTVLRNRMYELRNVKTWSTIIAIGQYSGYEVEKAIQYFVDFDNFIHQRGVIWLQNGGTNRVIYTIPDIDTNETNNLFYIPCKLPGETFSHTAVYITQTGQVVLLEDNRDVGLILDHIPPIRLQ